MSCPRCTPEQKCGSHVGHFKGHKHGAEARASMSASKKGITPTPRGAALKGSKRSDECRKKLSESIKKSWARGDHDNDPRSATKPELAVEQMLIELGLHYETQYRVHGYYVDFLVEGDLVVEVYGKYWHDRPERIKEDAVRMECIEEYGYDTLIIWDTELDNAKEVIRESVTARSAASW